MKRFVSTKRLLLAIVLSGAFLIAAACAGPEGSAGSRGADGPQGDPGPVGEAGSTISFNVEPQILRYPDKRMKGYGFWMYGSGLEPGQWFDIEIEAEDPTLSLQGFIKIRQANDDGAFAIGIEIRPDRMLSQALLEQYGPISLRLIDLDTSELLASASWVLCGSSREDRYCAVAVDPIPIK